MDHSLDKTEKEVKALVPGCAKAAAVPKCSEGGRDKSMPGNIHIPWKPVRSPTGSQCGNKDRKWPESLPSGDEQDCIVTSSITYTNGKTCMSQLDSLSPWQSLLTINTGNFLFSLILTFVSNVKALTVIWGLSLPTFGFCPQVREIGVLTAGRMSRTRPWYLLAVWPGPWRMTYEGFFPSQQNEGPMPTSNLKDCQKDEAKPCVDIFETTLREAPKSQLSKFPAFTKIGIRQGKQYSHRKAAA